MTFSFPTPRPLTTYTPVSARAIHAKFTGFIYEIEGKFCEKQSAKQWRVGRIAHTVNFQLYDKL